MFFLFCEDFSLRQIWTLLAGAGGGGEHETSSTHRKSQLSEDLKNSFLGGVESANNKKQQERSSLRLVKPIFHLSPLATRGGGGDHTIHPGPLHICTGAPANSLIPHCPPPPAPTCQLSHQYARNTTAGDRVPLPAQTGLSFIWGPTLLCLCVRYKLWFSRPHPVFQFFFGPSTDSDLREHMTVGSPSRAGHLTRQESDHKPQSDYTLLPGAQHGDVSTVDFVLVFVEHDFHGAWGQITELRVKRMIRMVYAFHVAPLGLLHLN